jgi:hypothetical protein
MVNRTSLMLFTLAFAAPPCVVLGKDDPACAKYQEPLAYNACLASHGPKATALGPSQVQTEPGQAAPVPSTRFAVPSRAGARSHYPTRHNGRFHMEFRVQ